MMEQNKIERLAGVRTGVSSRPFDRGLKIEFSEL